MRNKLPEIGKGGENITNNTYGFEVEFCTHDNSVFAFTHVEVADIKIGDLTDHWKLETDSGNVLELVTPPLTFPDAATAYAAKKRLTELLINTVNDQSLPNIGRAISIEHWITECQTQLKKFLQDLYCLPELPNITITTKTWNDISPQLNVNNVDDGINIQAALLRHQTNKNELWTAYVNQTVLSRSEKDWTAGFSSQMNMPMSLEGYFLYIFKKYEKSITRINAIIQDPGQAAATDMTLEKNITTWFWRSLLLQVFESYGTALFGTKKFTSYCQQAQHTTLLSEAEAREFALPLKQMALLYLTIEKILTGAIGRLSEPPQLQLQRMAWEAGSTQAILDDGSDLHRMRKLNTNWLEYHSSLKDLTGLWFKAALRDVLGREESTPGSSDAVIQYRQIAAQTLGTLRNDPWAEAFTNNLKKLNSTALDKLWRLRKTYSDTLDFPDLKSLLDNIQFVEAETKKMLPIKQTDFVLPKAEDRPFLEYPHNYQYWEGRYDTMVGAIAGDEATPPNWWKYLVEHRFN